MIKKFTKFSIMSALLTLSVAHAEVSLKDYKDFQTKWPLVTVRFREDSGEMRFTWGNEKAMSGLLAGKGDYADGSVFTKIGFISEEDPSFISSKVPSGSRRVQLMVRDKEKYASTDGWGYFLFDSSGEPVKTDVNACAACHRIVPERGYVFSQQMAFENLFKKPASSLPPLTISQSSVEFADKKLNELPSEFAKHIPNAKSLTARKLIKPFLPAAFEGTADELRPLLVKETLRSGKASYFLSADQKVLSFVTKAKEKNNCKEKQVFLKGVVAFVTEASASTQSEVRIREMTFCAVI